MTDPTLTTSEAAAALGLTRWAVLHAIRRGTLAADKRGRDYFLAHADVERYAARQADRRRAHKAVRLDPELSDLQDRHSKAVMEEIGTCANDNNVI